MTTKRINLALQGGGAHGAYTWGVLDRLLEEKKLVIAGVSGTSAGAMNAAVLVNGFVEGGNEGAKAALHDFWWEMSELGAFTLLNKTPIERFFTGWNLDWSPAYHAMDWMSRVFSPYYTNPTNINPLKKILENRLNISNLQACSTMQLFISATHVATGQPRVFSCEEITADVIMASACLPQLYQAVTIDGEHYWDGGYMGNPAIWPLLYHTECEDVLLVQINPLVRKELPTSAMEITNRLNEITFNASLVAEMRAIDFVHKLHTEHKLDRNKYKNPRMHMVYSPKALDDLNASSKMNVSWDFLQHLHELGRIAADRWLETHWDHIGSKSTLDIRSTFLCGPHPETHERIKKKELQ